MSMTAAELRAARERLRSSVREPDENGNYSMTIGEIVGLARAVQAVQGLSPRDLLDFNENEPPEQDDGEDCSGFGTTIQRNGEDG